MLTSMLLSQSLNYDGDVEEFVLQMTRYRRLVRAAAERSCPHPIQPVSPRHGRARVPSAHHRRLLAHRPQTKVTYSDFVDFYNALVDRIKLRQCMSSMGSGGGTAASSHLTSPGADAMGASCASSSESGRDVAAPTASASASIAQLKRRNFSGSAYLVSGAALKAVNGVYTQSGESDGVPKYTYKGAGGVQYSLLRRSVSGGRFWYIAESVAQPAPGPPAKEATGAAAPKCFFCLRSNAGTPPLEMPWERAKDGVLPGPFLTPISLTHAPPTSVLAPLTTFEIGDFVRANWAGRGVMYPGEVLASNHEDETLDILYDDGDFESHVPRQRVHPVSIELTDAFHAFGVGDVVKADLKGHGSWYTGRIIAIDTKFRVFVSELPHSPLAPAFPPPPLPPLHTLGSGSLGALRTHAPPTADPCATSLSLSLPLKPTSLGARRRSSMRMAILRSTCHPRACSPCRRATSSKTTCTASECAPTGSRAAPGAWAASAPSTTLRAPSMCSTTMARSSCTWQRTRCSPPRTPTSRQPRQSHSRLHAHSSRKQAAVSGAAAGWAAAASATAASPGEATAAVLILSFSQASPTGAQLYKLPQRSRPALSRCHRCVSSHGV